MIVTKIEVGEIHTPYSNGEKEMSGQSKTSAAAAKAVAKSNKKETTERTTFQVILDLRKNLAAGWAVTPLDVKTLLGEYDNCAADNVALLAQIKDLTAKNDEFREVYETENRRETVRVEKTLDGQTEVVVGVESSQKNSDVASIATGMLIAVAGPDAVDGLNRVLNGEKAEDVPFIVSPEDVVASNKDRFDDMPF